MGGQRVHPVRWNVWELRSFHRGNSAISLLKTNSSPLKTGRDPKGSSSNHPFSGVKPTRLKAFLMNTWVGNGLHFSNWNFKKKMWRQHNFCWMIRNIWSMCKMLSRILILSGASNKSWFHVGSKMRLPWVPFFWPTKRAWGDDRVEDLKRCLVHKIYPLNQELKSLIRVKMGEKRGLPRSMSLRQGWIQRMGLMMIHVQLSIVCTFGGPIFCWVCKPWNIII